MTTQEELKVLADNISAEYQYPYNKMDLVNAISIFHRVVFSNILTLQDHIGMEHKDKVVMLQSFSSDFSELVKKYTNCDINNIDTFLK